jgi:hypothetical protein
MPEYFGVFEVIVVNTVRNALAMSLPLRHLHVLAVVSTRS